MKFAVFDLDHTLLPIDSGDGWTRWLIKAAGMDAETMNARAQQYADAYAAGDFSADEFVRFQMGLLAQCTRADLDRWLDEFINVCVRPNIRPEALALLESRRKAGFEPVLASGTHRFVTTPIAKLFGIDHLIGARPEETAGGEFTGGSVGSHSYQEGKCVLLKEFLSDMEARHGEKVSCIEAYSDSINDLPLLRFAAEKGRAVAVNPDPKLRKIAAERGWKVMDIFSEGDE